MRAKKDGRSLSHTTRAELRKRAVQRVLDGESPEAVVAALGLHRSNIYRWLNAYDADGWAGLETRPIAGRPRKLADAYAQRLQTLICDYSPHQLNFHDALWTREMIAELVWHELGIEISVRTVTNVLKRLGMSPQKPRLKAYEQDPEAVKHWLNHTWPNIRRHAKRNGARLYFADEAAVRTDYHRGTTWALTGQTPTVETTGARYRANMISGISPRGALRFMVTQRRMTADVFIEFLKRLAHDTDAPVYVVVDGHPAQRAKKVQRYVESTQGQVRLFFLPGYSPELNPGEYVWGYIKAHKMGRQTTGSQQELFAAVYSALFALQKSVETIAQFFGPLYAKRPV